jgi:hypothetical protein
MSGKRRKEREAPRRVGSAAKSGKRREERETPRIYKRGGSSSQRRVERRSYIIAGRPPYRRAGNAEKSGKRHISERAGRFSQKRVERCILREGITFDQLIRKTTTLYIILHWAFSEFGWAMYCLYLPDYIIPPKQGDT